MLLSPSNSVFAFCNKFPISSTDILSIEYAAKSHFRMAAYAEIFVKKRTQMLQLLHNQLGKLKKCLHNLVTVTHAFAERCLACSSQLLVTR